MKKECDFKYIRMHGLLTDDMGVYKEDSKGNPQGNYLFEIYKVGFQLNDPYSTYLKMNKPKQLTKQKVDTIKNQNDGSPVVKEEIKVSSSSVFTKEIEIRENDVYFISLVKLNI